MRKVTICVLVAALAAIIIYPTTSVMGATTGDVTIQATSNTKLVLELNDLSVDFGNVDLDNGTEVAGAVDLRVKSNVPWNLEVKGNGDLAGSGADTVPINRLSWQNAAAPGYIPFALANDFVYQNHARGTTDHTFDYTIDIGYDYAPDTYNTSITYTLTQF
ncbi:MAG: hypothetical protein ACYC1U_01880 [Candidatus Aquicultorales bacterium]